MSLVHIVFMWKRKENFSTPHFFIALSMKICKQKLLFACQTFLIDRYSPQNSLQFVYSCELLVEQIKHLECSINFIHSCFIRTMVLCSYNFRFQFEQSQLVEECIFHEFIFQRRKSTIISWLFFRIGKFDCSTPKNNGIISQRNPIWNPSRFKCLWIFVTTSFFYIWSRKSWNSTMGHRGQ